MTLAREEHDTLLAVARAAIHHGLLHGRALAVVAADYPPALQATAATFVTLQIDGNLRGCIGTLEAHRPLVADVAANAWAAAFRDSRFPPLTPAEENRLALHISVLTMPRPFPVRDEADLLAKLRPDIDGLVLTDGMRHATFLPSVWEQLPDPRDFVAHLKRKAGLPAAHWSATMRVERYEVEEFSG